MSSAAITQHPPHFITHSVKTSMGKNFVLITIIVLWAHCAMGSSDAPKMGQSSDEPQFEISNAQLAMKQQWLMLSIACSVGLLLIVCWWILIHLCLTLFLPRCGNSICTFLSLRQDKVKVLICLCFAINVVCSLMASWESSKTHTKINALNDNMTAKLDMILELLTHKK
jgi:hypothetical protein